MLVGGDHVDMAGNPGHGSGRDAVGGIDIPVVGSRVPVRFADQLAALDGRGHVDVVGRHAEGALGDEQIRENDGRTLVAIDQVEHLGDGAESVVGVLRGHHDPFEIALAGSERLPEVTLLGLGGHSGRGPGAHHVDEHHRNLHHGGRSDGLGHEGEAAARRGAHGAGPGVGRSHRHVGHADLVLDLAHHDAEFAGVLGHPVEHARRGAHGIGAVELDARGRPAHRQGFVPGPDRERVGLLREGVRQRSEVGARVFVTGAGDRDVGRDHRLALSLELERERRLQDLEVESQHMGDDAQRGRVLRQLVLRVPGEFDHRHAAEMNAVLVLPGGDVVGVVHRVGAGAQMTQVARHGVLVQAEEQVDVVAMRKGFLLADPHGQQNVSAPDDGLIGVVGVEMESPANEHPGKDVAGRGNSLPGSTPDGDGKVETL